MSVRLKLWSLWMLPLWRLRCGYWAWDAVMACWRVREQDGGE